MVAWWISKSGRCVADGLDERISVWRNRKNLDFDFYLVERNMVKLWATAGKNGGQAKKHEKTVYCRGVTHGGGVAGETNWRPIAYPPRKKKIFSSRG